MGTGNSQPWTDAPYGSGWPQGNPCNRRRVEGATGWEAAAAQEENSQWTVTFVL